MSQQQVSNKSLTQHLELAKKTLKEQGDKYYINKHFKIDKNYNKYRFIKAKFIYESLCTDDCEVLDYLRLNKHENLKIKTSASQILRKKNRDDEQDSAIYNLQNVILDIQSQL